MIVKREDGSGGGSGRVPKAPVVGPAGSGDPGHVAKAEEDIYVGEEGNAARSHSRTRYRARENTT